MVRVDSRELRRFTEALLVELGTPERSAEQVAMSLVDADLRGHGSHGVRRIVSQYAAEIEAGRIDPIAEPIVESDDTAVGRVEGRRSFGHLTARTALDLCVRKADTHGVGVVGLKGSTHIGRIGEWVERGTREGKVVLAFVCNPETRWVSPPGSAQRRFSTNPIAIGVPTFDAVEFPIVVDIATSQVAFGKIDKYAAAGETVPSDWLIGPDGDELRDPNRYMEGGKGALLPLGGRTSGYKGFGLALLSELLAATLSDGDVSGMDCSFGGNQAAFLAIDPERFTSRKRTVNRAAALAAYVRETEFLDTVSRETGATDDYGLLPGEAEHRSARRRRNEGIPLSRNDASSLRDLFRRHTVRDDIVPDVMGNVDG